MSRETRGWRLEVTIALATVFVTGGSYGEEMLVVDPDQDLEWSEQSPFREQMLQGPSKSDTHTSALGELDALPSGPFLAAALRAIDIETLSGHERVAVLRAHQRMASHYQAEIYRDIAAVADHFEELDDGDLELAHQGTVAEVRAALTLTRRSADVEVELALDLRRRLPAVWQALRRGDIDVRRARTIANGTSHLSEDIARSVVSSLIHRAPTLTTGQLAAHIRKSALAADPESVTKDYEQAVDRRRVMLEALPSGAAELIGSHLPAHRAAAAADRINYLARSLNSSDETRTMDQLRADVMLDLLMGTETSASRERGGVHLHVDLDTLAKLNQQPGDLAGYGPVVADIARQVAAGELDRRWDYTITDAESGEVVGTGTTRRRPNTRQRRHARGRTQTCVFPGCRMPSVGCDLDHRVDWAHGGPTTTTNLDPLCRHDHGNKHGLGWTYKRLPGGGYEWTTKLGHTYISQPP